MNLIRWARHPLAEPSTHTAIATFIGFLTLYLHARSMDGWGWTEPMLLWAAAHALLGLVLGARRKAPA